MAVSPETRAFVADLFDDLPDITMRAMFGGLAIYSRGRIFALVTSDDRIYLKAGGAFAERLASEGSTQFAYPRGTGGMARMGYWTLPESALDDGSEACDWARASLAANDPTFS